jgi:hypothetical protein
MVKKIIDVCYSSPSGGGLQSFEIYSIDNLEIKNQIVKASMDQEFIAEAPLLLVFCANPTRSSMVKKQNYFQYKKLPRCSICSINNMCTRLIISMGWSIYEEKVSTILSLPDNIIPYCFTSYWL